MYQNLATIAPSTYHYNIYRTIENLSYPASAVIVAVPLSVWIARIGNIMASSENAVVTLQEEQKKL